MKEIRLLSATHANQEVAVKILASAFDADPPLNWLLRKDGRRDTAFYELFSIGFAKMTFPFGCVDITENQSGVALWTPPNSWKLELLTELSLLPAFLRIFGPKNFLRGLSAVNRVQAVHPKVPHYYLFAMGVYPAEQKQGLGSALLHYRLAQCDKEGVPAYLEASTENSRALYERMGFVVREVLEMGPGAPPVWTMWREPGADL